MINQLKIFLSMQIYKNYLLSCKKNLYFFKKHQKAVARKKKAVPPEWGTALRLLANSYLL